MSNKHSQKFDSEHQKKQESSRAHKDQEAIAEIGFYKNLDTKDPE